MKVRKHVSLADGEWHYEWMTDAGQPLWTPEEMQRHSEEGFNSRDALDREAEVVETWYWDTDPNDPRQWPYGRLVRRESG